MPTIQVSELITRAKIAADMENTNFVSPAGWLHFANAEWRALYTRVARLGWPLQTTIVEIPLTGLVSYAITAPAAVLYVRQAPDGGGRLKRVEIKSEMSLSTTLPRAGTAKEVFISRASGDSLILRPNPTPATGVFRVGTIPYPVALVISNPSFDQTSSISIPLGWEERLVLGMARRALSKEETTNSAIEREIAETDNIIENSCFSYVLSEANTVLDMDELYDANYDNWYWA